MGDHYEQSTGDALLEIAKALNRIADKMPDSPKPQDDVLAKVREAWQRRKTENGYGQVSLMKDLKQLLG